jgi:hypothetical protein
MQMSENKSKEITTKLRRFIDKKKIDIYGFTNKIPEGLIFTKKGIRGNSVIILGIHMVDEFLDLWIETDAYSRCFSDEILRAYCYEISLFLERHGYTSEPLPYNGAYLKDLGELAGLGKIGKNNLLITPEFGPNIRLRAIITEAKLENNPELDFNPCADCDMPCIKNCPADAFNKNEQITKRPNDYVMQKCLSYQKKHLKYISDVSKLWCQICIENCKFYR